MTNKNDSITLIQNDMDQEEDMDQYINDIQVKLGKTMQDVHQDIQ